MASLTTTAIALAKFAPSLLRYFGVGETSSKVAEKAIDIAKAVTGAGSIEQALGALERNAEAARLFHVEIVKADGDLEKAYLADRGDARARDLEVRKLNDGQNTRQDVMIIGAVLGLIACLGVLVFFSETVPGEVVGILSMIAGIFGACLKDAYAFEFGSSRGSKEKDAVLGEIARMP